ncbi:DNA-3-methyladenine glycosylase II [Rubrivivax sp. A210]|uniref:DNA-3-methyladenine glycosylase family protein n=1 Tax=Rubrivivax sp. A210 TaxID=2772301 RepID=UPI001918FC52|nr:DNA-3-methyladenine glycosylase 2 family protein [Rubrivivax sp. A210]CAD5366150.1 DNA-3-methyladenine glycosylase II [Rubrivivax sp. A210]
MPRLQREAAAAAVDAAVAATPAPGAPAVTSVETPAETPGYWDEACRHLGRRDRVMKKLIPRFGEARLSTRGDAFTTLARSIVGQQISVKAAQSVWLRFVAIASPQGLPLRPAVVRELAVDAMRGAGLSARKCEYLLDLACHFGDGAVHEADWLAMDDEAIIAELVAIRGIGRWTAEMFLIFHLLRPNVLPLDDVGLIKGISLNYFSGEPVSRAEAREVGEAWAPFRSVATWYIWRSLDPLPVEY